MHIRDRIELLRQYDPDAAENLILDTVNQYMMVRTSVDTIAARMGYSVGWVCKARDRLRARFRADAEKLDVKNYTMEMLDQLKEIAAMGFREAAMAKAPEYGRRMAGIAAARSAIADQSRLLQLAGAYDSAPLHVIAQAENEGESATPLQEMSRLFLGEVTRLRGGVRPGDVIIDADPSVDDD